MKSPSSPFWRGRRRPAGLCSCGCRAGRQGCRAGEACSLPPGPAVSFPLTVLPCQAAHPGGKHRERKGLIRKLLMCLWKLIDKSSVSTWVHSLFLHRVIIVLNGFSINIKLNSVYSAFGMSFICSWVLFVQPPQGFTITGWIGLLAWTNIAGLKVVIHSSEMEIILFWLLSLKYTQTKSCSPQEIDFC